MANQTIYPYGQGGQLPSGYPIADDLNTDSAQQALSARQGKVIGDYLGDDIGDGRDYPVDISSLSLRSYSIGSGSSSTNRWLTSGRHKTIPVTPGQRYKLTVSSASTDGGFYAFFTSDFVEPTGNSSSLPYVTGTSRVWRLTTDTSLVTVPETAAYLVICPKDGSGNDSTWVVALHTDRVISEEYVSKETDIVDNLTTGGAKKVLSAQQGKVIGDYLFDTFTPIDLSELTVSDYSVGSSDWKSNGKHSVIPVIPGDVLRASVSAQSADGGWYAFFTDSYTPPASTSATVPYVVGTTRTWLLISEGTVTITIPEGTAYFCFCPKDGDSHTSTWTISERTRTADIRDDYLAKDSVVNNLRDGGTSKPLSAEQGKNLASFVTDGIPENLQPVTYTGAPIKFNKTRKVAKVAISKITAQAFQGGACFGDYLFMFTANNTTCWMYNLATQQLVQTISIPSDQRGFVSDCHANTANFGTEYYDAQDPFPLIYVSTGYASGGYTGALVYRIVATTEQDVTTYSLSLVQTLKIPGTEWSEFVVGEEDDCYVCHTTSRVIYRMVMPKLSDGDMTFDFENALEKYQFTLQPEWFQGSRNQNRIYHNGKIYLVSGVPASGEKGLFIVLDLATCRRETVIDLSTLGLTGEPETLFFWNGAMCVVFRSASTVYALYFE